MQLGEIINSKVGFNHFGLFMFSVIMVACLIWHGLAMVCAHNQKQSLNSV